MNPSKRSKIDSNMIKEEKEVYEVFGEMEYESRSNGEMILDFVWKEH